MEAENSWKWKKTNLLGGCVDNNIFLFDSLPAFMSVWPRRHSLVHLLCWRDCSSIMREDSESVDIFISLTLPHSHTLNATNDRIADMIWVKYVCVCNFFSYSSSLLVSFPFSVRFQWTEPFQPNNMWKLKRRSCLCRRVRVIKYMVKYLHAATLAPGWQRVLAPSTSPHTAVRWLLSIIFHTKRKEPIRHKGNDLSEMKRKTKSEKWNTRNFEEYNRISYIEHFTLD